MSAVKKNAKSTQEYNNDVIDQLSQIPCKALAIHEAILSSVRESSILTGTAVDTRSSCRQAVADERIQFSSAVICCCCLCYLYFIIPRGEFNSLCMVGGGYGLGPICPWKSKFAPRSKPVFKKKKKKKKST